MCLSLCPCEPVCARSGSARDLDVRDEVRLDVCMRTSQSYLQDCLSFGSQGSRRAVPCIHWSVMDGC